MIKQICIDEKTTVRQALSTIDSSGLGAVVMLDSSGAVARTVTDGDLRPNLSGVNWMNQLARFLLNRQ